MNYMNFIAKRGSTQNFRPLLLKMPPFSILVNFCIKMGGGRGVKQYYAEKLHCFIGFHREFEVENLIKKMRGGLGWYKGGGAGGENMNYVKYIAKRGSTQNFRSLILKMPPISILVNFCIRGGGGRG